MERDSHSVRPTDREGSPGPLSIERPPSDVARLTATPRAELAANQIHLDGFRKLSRASYLLVNGVAGIAIQDTLIVWEISEKVMRVFQSRNPSVPGRCGQGASDQPVDPA